MADWTEWSETPGDNLAYDECVDCRFGIKEEE